MAAAVGAGLISRPDEPYLGITFCRFVDVGLYLDYITMGSH